MFLFYEPSSRKRKLDMGGSNVTSENDLWNDVHVSLVQDLEKKGMMWRYNINHLKHWTDMIIDGRSTGIGDEPEWEKYIDMVKVAPKNRRSSRKSSQTSSLNTSLESDHVPSIPQTTAPQANCNNVMEMLLIQNQQHMELESKKSDMFQSP